MLSPGGKLESNSIRTRTNDGLNKPVESKNAETLTISVSVFSPLNNSSQIYALIDSGASMSKISRVTGPIFLRHQGHTEYGTFGSLIDYRIGLFWERNGFQLGETDY